jgi:glycosyltransferase involved in cell wall biosynthesis
MTALTFSVATPARNALFNLRRCVGSVRGQRPGSRVEHLIQVAQSADGTEAWLETQQGLSARVESDLGMYDAINRAWARSAGDVLSWLNADEQYLPGTLERVRGFLQQHPDVDVVSANSIVVDPDGLPIAARREVPFRTWYVKNSFLNTMSCTLFFRRRLLDLGWLRFDPAYRFAGDMDLMLGLAARGARFAHMDSYLSLFGLGTQNLSASRDRPAETVAVQQKFKAYRWEVLRNSVLVARRVERWIRGSYKLQALTYQFALDEAPHYLTVEVQGLGGRYSLESRSNSRCVLRREVDPA